MTHAQLKNAIQMYLTCLMQGGLCYFDMLNSGTLFVPPSTRGGRKIPGRRVKLCREGTADFYALVKGVHIAIEAKADGDKQSDEQYLFQLAIEQAGGVYLEVRDVRTLHEALCVIDRRVERMDFQ